jgi:hypothetical protein
MNYFFQFLLVVLILFTTPLFPAKAIGQDIDADITDIIITTSDTNLLLFSTVKHGFTKEMLEGVRNGIPVTFTFFIGLEQIKSHWFDSTLAEQTISHTLTFNNLKEEYTVELSERDNQTITTNSAIKAQEIMSEINGIKVIERSDLIPDTQYALSIKATLAEKKLPLNMHYIVPFISLWNFETDWRTIEFRY